MKVTVIGTGYVGLVTGTCLAHVGNEVTCVDIDAEKVYRMKAGEVPIYEPDLELLFKQNIEAGRLKFTTDLSDGIKGSEVIFLALPTPARPDGAADLSFILSVAKELTARLDHYAVIVNKSTVPIGTAAKVKKIIGKNKNNTVDVVSSPEFLREGYAVYDFMHPDRVVIGTSSEKAEQIMKEVYKPFVTEAEQIIIMNEESAEMTKYAANSFLATKISFMNEIANLCELVGADVDAVRIGMGKDNRIGTQFLQAGIGFGGGCFPKDVSALQQIAAKEGYELRILQAVSKVNSDQKLVLVNKIMEYMGYLKDRKIAIWGLAFKPNTDDTRESPAIEIIKELTLRGATVTAYDPKAAENVKKFAPNLGIVFADDMYKAAKNADALIIATEWNVFANADLDKLKSVLKHPSIFDGRNIFDPLTMKDNGFHYVSIGRTNKEVKNT